MQSNCFFSSQLILWLILQRSVSQPSYTNIPFQKHVPFHILVCTPIPPKGYERNFSLEFSLVITTPSKNLHRLKVFCHSLFSSSVKKSSTHNFLILQNGMFLSILYHYCYSLWLPTPKRGSKRHPSLEHLWPKALGWRTSWGSTWPQMSQHRGHCSEIFTGSLVSRSKGASLLVRHGPEHPSGSTSHVEEMLTCGKGKQKAKRASHQKCPTSNEIMHVLKK